MAFIALLFVGILGGALGEFIFVRFLGRAFAGVTA